MTDPKDYLRKMIDYTIDGDSENADKAFKDYLIPKTMEVLGINTNSKAPLAKENEPKAEAEPAKPNESTPEKTEED